MNDKRIEETRRHSQWDILNTKAFSALRSASTSSRLQGKTGVVTLHPAGVGSTTSGPERLSARFTKKNGTEQTCAAVFFEFARSQISQKKSQHLDLHYRIFTLAAVQLHPRKAATVKILLRKL